ncbi:MAG: glycosyl hydrolase family 28 protein [Bacteroidota bacterium]
MRALLLIGLGSCLVWRIAAQNNSPWSAAQAAAEAAAAWATLPDRMASIHPPQIPQRVLDVVELGADPSGQTDSRAIISAAIERLAQLGGGKLVVPAQAQLRCDGPIHLRSGLELHLAAGSRITFSDNPEHYLPLVEVRWEGTRAFNYSPLIYAKGQTDIALTGTGTIDGNGLQWSIDWRKRQQPAQNRLRQMGSDGIPLAKRRFGPGSYLRPSLLMLYECRRVRIEGLTFRNSPFWTIHLPFTDQVRLAGLSIYGNTLNDDGIDPDSSQDVLIEDCYIETHDDAISIKSGRDRDGWAGRPSRNIIVRNCRLNSGVNAFAIGSELSGGISEIFVENVRLLRGRRGLTIKTNSDRGGYVKDIFVRNLEADSLSKGLVVFRTDYHGYRGGQHPTQVSGIYLEDLRARLVAGPAIQLQGLAENPIKRVYAANFDLGQVAASKVENAFQVYLEDGRRIGPEGELDEAIRSGADYAAQVLIGEQGFSRCDYDWRSGRWRPYEAAWHTGQVIYGLLHAYRATGESDYLKAARKAGDWWLSLVIGPDRPELAGYLAAVHDGPVGELINFTTIADGTPGLFELSRVSGDQRYADAAVQAGQWALDHLYLPEEGLIIDLVELASGEILRDRSPFYDGELSIHQVARPNNEGFLFYDAYRHTGLERYQMVFLNLCNSLVEKQDSSGFWLDYHPNDRERGKIHPRSNTWYAESLLKGYELTGNERYLEAALRTARALQALQQKDGGMYYHNYLGDRPNRASLCGSAVSFAGILWLELSRLGYAEFELSVERAKSWVLSNRFATDHPDPNLSGGFLETRRYRRPDGVVINVRDIATAFGLRFLVRYREISQEKTSGQ